MTFTIIRTDGREESHTAPAADVWKTIERLIDAAALAGVNLHDGRVMFVDDNGYDVELVEHPPSDGYDVVVERKATRPRKPVNPKATALYHAICKPDTTHAIVGDVAIVRDGDFADDDP